MSGMGWGIRRGKRAHRLAFALQLMNGARVCVCVWADGGGRCMRARVRVLRRVENRGGALHSYVVGVGTVLEGVDKARGLGTWCMSTSPMNMKGGGDHFFSDLLSDLLALLCFALLCVCAVWPFMTSLFGPPDDGFDAVVVIP